MKLKKGVDPKNTRHHIPTMTPTGVTEPIYRVSRVIGGSAFFPQEGVLVELAFDGDRSPHHYPPYLMLTLDTLASDGVAVTEADIFWKSEKSDVDIQTEEAWAGL